MREPQIAATNAGTIAQRYVLWGSAGHAKVLAGLIALRGGRVVALFDNREIQSSLDGVMLYIGDAGFNHWADDTDSLANVIGLAAIGGNHGRDRLAVHARFRHRGLQVRSLVHPSASVCATAIIGSGTQVLAHAIVSSEARIGEACILNHRATIDHECVLGDGVHIAPGATLCGCVTLGDNVMVGAGAVVLPRLTIGADSVIGAGAVITKDIPAGVTVMGNPGRVVNKH